MKFKRLTIDELKELEPEFITFLASNQVTADDWVKIKANDPKRMNELFDFFSDLVYEKVLKKINYLEHRSAKEINLFYCGEEKISLLGIKVNDENDIDFKSENILEQLQHASQLNASMFASEKSYKTERELEIFEMLQSGCLITDDRLFNILLKTRDKII